MSFSQAVGHPEIWGYVGGFLLTVAISWLLTLAVKRLALRRGWTDDPNNDRKVHDHPIPRVGGIAIIAAVGMGLLYFYGVEWFFGPSLGFDFRFPSSALLVGALTIGVVGLYDDLEYLAFEHKFLFQVVVASIVINAGYVIDTVPNPVTGEAFAVGWIGVPVTLVWIVGIINAVNLLDGLDGLAAGTSLITFGSLAAAFSATGATTNLPLVLVLSGALAGFLVYNFNPASIFMGDCGSTFLGFLLATYSIQGPHQTNSLLAFLIPILATGLPVLDTGLSLVRRFLEQRPLFQPDRDHIHHRIARRFGLTHRMTVLVLYGVSLTFGLLAFSAAVASDTLRTVVVLAAGIVIYLFLRALGYFRLRDLPWLIREREEFGKIRRFVEGEGNDHEMIRENGAEEEVWLEESEDAALANKR